jgi:thioredoxin-related protein
VVASRRLFGFCLISAAFFFSSASASGLEFLSYEDAVSVARSEGKDVYVLFGGEECPWCNKQKDVLAKDSVVRSLSRYVVCYVDTGDREDLARRYRVRAIPVSVLIDADERVVRKNVGYMDESKLLGWLR